MKPRLPIEYEAKLSPELLAYLYTFVPHMPKEKWPSNTQKHIEILQKSPKRNAMDLKGLEDFILH